MWDTLTATARTKTGRLTLVVVGCAVIAAAFMQDNSRDGFAATGLAVGALLVLAGCALPWIKRAEASAGRGLRIETRSEAEVSSAVAVEVTEEVAAAGGAASVDVDVDELTDAVRFFVAGHSLARLFALPGSALADCDFHLYLYDADLDRLMPVFEPDDRASHGWAVGQGVTGAAYLLEQYVAATGSETHDGTYDLTAEQQARYADLTAVAAMPVFNAAGQCIAVLSASSRNLDTRLVAQEGYEEHLTLALSSGRLLVDLLK